MARVRSDPPGAAGGAPTPTARERIVLDGACENASIAAGHGISYRYFESIEYGVAVQGHPLYPPVPNADYVGFYVDGIQCCLSE